MPPALDGVSSTVTQYKYNLDKQLIQIRRPDGQVIDLVHDSVKKRLNRMDLPNDKSLNYAYNDLTGKLKTVSAPGSSTLSYTYDGSLALSENKRGQARFFVLWCLQNNPNLAPFSFCFIGKRSLNLSH